jgi:hypothetical protein
MLMECLSAGRAISLPALATGCGKLAYRYTGAYTRVRRQFNVPISSFEGIEEALGYIAGYAYILEACRIMTAGAVDLQINPAIASAMAKYHMTEMSRKITQHALDIHAGHMIQVGPRNFLANVYFAIPISITVEGANILTRNLIIFGQGAIRCHPYLLKEIAVITSSEPNIDELDNLLMSHIGYFVSNLVRNIGYGLTGGKLIFSSVKNARIKKYHKQLTRMSAALALLADTSLLILGGSLKRRERISARLGDIMSQLYLASAVLKYYFDNNQPNTDVDYVSWCLQECLLKIQTATDELLNNFSPHWIGKLLSWIIFPYGQAYRHPKDKLHKKIVSPMLEPSNFRNRLTQHCYLSNKEDEIGCRLDKALASVDAMDVLSKKVHKAVQSGVIPHRYDFNERVSAAVDAGILTHEECHAFRDFEALRSEVIKVNEFSFDLNRVIA